MSSTQKQCRSVEVHSEDGEAAAVVSELSVTEVNREGAALYMVPQEEGEEEEIVLQHNIEEHDVIKGSDAKREEERGDRVNQQMHEVSDDDEEQEERDDKVKREERGVVERGIATTTNRVHPEQDECPFPYISLEELMLDMGVTEFETTAAQNSSEHAPVAEDTPPRSDHLTARELRYRINDEEEEEIALVEEILFGRVDIDQVDIGEVDNVDRVPVLTCHLGPGGDYSEAVEYDRAIPYVAEELAVEEEEAELEVVRDDRMEDEGEVELARSGLHMERIAKVELVEDEEGEEIVEQSTSTDDEVCTSLPASSNTRRDDFITSITIDNSQVNSGRVTSRRRRGRRMARSTYHSAAASGISSGSPPDGDVNSVSHASEGQEEGDKVTPRSKFYYRSSLSPVQRTLWSSNMAAVNARRYRLLQCAGVCGCVCGCVYMCARVHMCVYVCIVVVVVVVN